MFKLLIIWTEKHIPMGCRASCMWTKALATLSAAGVAALLAAIFIEPRDPVLALALAVSAFAFAIVAAALAMRAFAEVAEPDLALSRPRRHQRRALTSGARPRPADASEPS